MHPAPDRSAPHPKSRLALLLCAALTLASAGAAGVRAQSVLPSGAQVASGSATVTTSGTALTVNQTSNSAILNWQSFSIGAGNSVRFNQPSASSVALNRVVGNNRSELFGSLSSNGQVFLVNQNGITMGPNSQIDTGGFVGSTLGIKDSDFNAGRYLFDRANNVGGLAGTIVNQGSIVTANSYTALIAPQVNNSGVIVAQQGRIGIAAGDTVALDLVGDGFLSLKIQKSALDAAVVNTGTLQADGGSVVIYAASANALLDTVINSAGVVRANTLANVNGRILLYTVDQGATIVSGEVSARGANPGEKGGEISILGNKVGLVGTGRLDASGVTGGGTVLLGGNSQGQGSERNALATYVGPDAVIDASATSSSSEGGKVVVWSETATSFAGTIRSGGITMFSGRIDVASKNRVDASGTLSSGTILLTGADVNVSGMTFHTPSGGLALFIEHNGAGAPYVPAPPPSAPPGAGGSLTVTVGGGNTPIPAPIPTPGAGAIVIGGIPIDSGPVVTPGTPATTRAIVNSGAPAAVISLTAPVASGGVAPATSPATSPPSGTTTTLTLQSTAQLTAQSSTLIEAQRAAALRAVGTTNSVLAPPTLTAPLRLPQ